MRWVFLLSFPGFFLFSCSSKGSGKSQSLSVLTYNVENLFDTQHDLGKLDYAYLPLREKRGALKESVDRYCSSIFRNDWKKECRELDWSPERYEEKLRRVAQVIAESTPGCPDLVILQEIENEKVLERLEKLVPCNYASSTLSDNRDERGIDIALLSKFEIESAKTHGVPYSSMDRRFLSDTRGILDAIVRVYRRKLRILGLHMPAPFHPPELRKEALAFVEKLYFEDSGQPLIVAGDFNVIEKENLEQKSFESLRKNFYISDDLIRDRSQAEGSSYYAAEDSWSFLDKVLLSRNAFNDIDCKVVNYLPGLREKAKGAPLSFPRFGPLRDGVSDHFPVLCRATI